MAVKRPPGIDPPRTEPATRLVNTFVRPEPPALPADAPARTDLLRLAQSLSGTSEAMGEFARAYTRGTSEQGQSEAFGLRLRTPAADLTRMLNTPGAVPPTVNRAALELGHGEDLARQHFEDIRRRYLGENTAPAGQPSNAFDRNGGDLNEWFSRVTREREGLLPPQEGVRFGWSRRMLDFRTGLYTEHDRFLSQRTLQANLDAAHQSFYGIATTAIAEGIRDPREIHRRMLDSIPRTRQMHLLTPEQANAALFSAARAIAEQGIPGNPALAVDVVREMLLGQRAGPNGTTLPPLGNSQQYAHLTNQVIEAATRRAGELQRNLSTESIVRFREQAANGQLDEEAFNRFITDNPHIMGPSTQSHRETILLANRRAVEQARAAQLEAAERAAREARSQQSRDELDRFLMRRGDEGTLQSIPERMTELQPNGETREIQRSALLDRARDRELARIAEWARQTREAERDTLGSMGIETGQPPPANTGPSIEDRVFERTREFLNRNGLVHPAWRDILASGYAAATPQALAGNQPPPILAEAIGLYERLEANAPGMLERHLQSQAARDFYRTYRLGRTSLRMDERQAMAFAATATNDVGADESRAVPFRRIEDELGRSRSIFPWSETVNNFGDMRPEIGRLARGLVRAGVAPEEAVRLAGENVRSQYTNINGFMVRTGDRVTESYGAILRGAGLQARSFEDSVRRYLERYALENPLPGDTANDWLTSMLFPPESGATPPAAPGRRLSIRPVTEGTGAWIIIDPTTGLPVPTGPNGMRQTIGLRDLLEFERRAQTEERRTEAERLAAEAERERQRALEHGRRKPPRPIGGWPDDGPPE